MEYILLEHVRHDKLADLVNQYLADGWKLYGDPFSRVHVTCQAMTKGDYRSVKKSG